MSNTGLVSAVETRFGSHVLPLLDSLAHNKPVLQLRKHIIERTNHTHSSWKQLPHDMVGGHCYYSCCYIHTCSIGSR
jgi:hypothetical protein